MDHYLHILHVARTVFISISTVLVSDHHLSADFVGFVSSTRIYTVMFDLAGTTVLEKELLTLPFVRLEKRKVILLLYLDIRYNLTNNIGYKEL